MPDQSVSSAAQRWLARFSISTVKATEPLFTNLTEATYTDGEFLVHTGDTGDTLFLIETGLVRLYYVTPEGKERNKAFYRDGDITGPVSAALTDSPAPFSIQCLKNTKTIRFHLQDLLNALQHNEQLAHLYRELLAEAFIRNEQREAMLLTGDGEQRYRWLLDNEPQLLEEVAQFHIASYLGLDAVSLSRLKKKLSD